VFHFLRIFRGITGSGKFGCKALVNIVICGGGNVLKLRVLDFKYEVKIVITISI
jgi:hypothetical protein